VDLHRRDRATTRDTSGTVNDKINKADADCSSIAGYTVTYDGNAHTATGSCKGVDGLDLAGLDLSGTTHTAAGTYDDDPWTFTDVTGNYSDTSGTVNDKINKARRGLLLDSPATPSPTTATPTPPPARARASTAWTWPAWTCRARPTPRPAPTTTTRGPSPT
jgi:hypothetical protein